MNPIVWLRTIIECFSSGGKCVGINVIWGFDYYQLNTNAFKTTQSISSSPMIPPKVLAHTIRVTFLTPMFQCNKYIKKDFPNECIGFESKCIILRFFRLGLESCKPMLKHLLQSVTSISTTGLSNASISDSHSVFWLGSLLLYKVE